MVLLMGIWDAKEINFQIEYIFGCFEVTSSLKIASLEKLALGSE